METRYSVCLIKDIYINIYSKFVKILVWYWTLIKTHKKQKKINKNNNIIKKKLKKMKNIYNI